MHAKSLIVFLLLLGPVWLLRAEIIDPKDYGEGTISETPRTCKVQLCSNPNALTEEERDCTCIIWATKDEETPVEPPLVKTFTAIADVYRYSFIIFCLFIAFLIVIALCACCCLQCLARVCCCRCCDGCCCCCLQLCPCCARNQPPRVIIRSAQEDELKSKQE